MKPERYLPADIVCFGEVLMRLTAPVGSLLAQADTLGVRIGGAEANVAVALAALEWRSAVASVVPSGPLGRRARTFLRGAGVDTTRIADGPGRLGLYFLTQGASLRASDVTYDRAGSAFATTDWRAVDWDTVLYGARWLHVSGITPALGPEMADATLTAMRAARARGIRISFDANYRARLWESWDSDPRAILRELVAHADLFFANHRDMTLLLDAPFSGDGPERRREAAQAAFAAFPNLRWIASTARVIAHVDCHWITARLDTPSDSWQTRDVEVAGIVDRIGAGDAFAAGVLHGLMGNDDEDGREALAIEYGLALTCLKHSLTGDAALFDQHDIDSFLAGGLDVRR